MYHLKYIVTLLSAIEVSISISSIIHCSISHSRCQDLILLETYTTKTGSDLELPSFLDITQEVTDVSDYSMFNLSILSPSTPPTSNGPPDN